MIYSAVVDMRLLENDFPKIARAVEIVRDRLGFRGNVNVNPKLKKGRLGEACFSTQEMSLISLAEQAPDVKVLEIVVHEAIHLLGMHHEENFRSHGGKRCIHSLDPLSHCVAAILDGRETWKNMMFLRTHIGAYSNKLLRQVARVEAIVARQRGILETLGDCKGLAEINYRWQQMTARQKAEQQAKMQIGRLKRLGYTFSDEQRTLEREIEMLEARYR